MSYDPSCPEESQGAFIKGVLETSAEIVRLKAEVARLTAERDVLIAILRECRNAILTFSKQGENRSNFMIAMALRDIDKVLGEQNNG